MRTVLLASICAVVLVAGLAVAANPPQASAIRQSVASAGAKATVEGLAKAGQWEAVTAKIGSGDAAWIALAPLLAPGADAGHAEGLGLALATALPKNVAAVLGALDPDPAGVVGASHVCNAPFIEMPEAEEKAYVAAALAGLQAVSDPALASAKAACVGALQAVPAPG